MIERLPEIPEPTEVEIEFTNICNAVCTACPRNDLVVPKGYMEPSLFYDAIDKYAEYRPALKINQLRNSLDFPFLTFAGLGEPLIHKNAFDFIRYARQKNFRTVLFTNASRLNPENAQRLADTGITDVYISFWGIQKDEYEAAMRLPFQKTLRNVEFFAEVAAANQIKLLVTWVQVDQLSSTPEEIREFWRSRGIKVDTDDEAPENRSASNQAWNRGGSLTTIPRAAMHSEVNFEKDIWCSQLYFTDTICWNGDFILCSQDYFRKTEVLGNIASEDPKTLGRKKQEIFRDKIKSPICVRCRKQRDYSIATYPWDAILPVEELRRYRYELP
jgi:sulfatase maturation enzyme AslB (radical SAM superfamily)